MEDYTNFVHNFTAGGTVAVATLPADISSRHLFLRDLTNEGGADVTFVLAQKRSKNAFTSKGVVPANSNVFNGGNVNNQRILRFDAGATIEAQVPQLNATLSVNLGFIDE